MTEKKLFTIALRITGLVIFLKMLGTVISLVYSFFSQPNIYYHEGDFFLTILGPFTLCIISALFLFKPGIFARWLKLSEDNTDTSDYKLSHLFQIAIFSVGLVFAMKSLPYLISDLIYGFGNEIKLDYRQNSMYRPDTHLLTRSLQFLIAILFITNNKAIAKWVIKKNKQGNEE